MTEHETRDQADQRAAYRMVADAARWHCEALELVEATKRLAAEMIAQAQGNADRCGETFERLRAEFGDVPIDAELAPPCANCGSRIRYSCASDCAGRVEPEPAPEHECGAGCSAVPGRACVGGECWRDAPEPDWTPAEAGGADVRYLPAAESQNGPADVAALAADCERLLEANPWALAAIGDHPDLLLGTRVYRATDTAAPPAVGTLTYRYPDGLTGNVQWFTADIGDAHTREQLAELRPVRAR